MSWKKIKSYFVICKTHISWSETWNHMQFIIIIISGLSKTHRKSKSNLKCLQTIGTPKKVTNGAPLPHGLLLTSVSKFKLILSGCKNSLWDKISVINWSFHVLCVFEQDTTCVCSDVRGWPILLCAQAKVSAHKAASDRPHRWQKHWSIEKCFFKQSLT